jgi:aryl-alcohol dehydrogenase-like predicted oxidoreductase
MFDGVTCAIPGARTESQSRENAASAALPALPESTMTAAREIYEADIRPLVHERW